MNSGLVLAPTLCDFNEGLEVRSRRPFLMENSQFCFILVCLVYLVIYSLMLFSNYSHNIFRREINKSVLCPLFKKVILNPKFSNDEKLVC